MAKRTAQLTYTGRHRNGVIVGDPGARVFIRWGDTEEVDAALAEQLCKEQPTEFSIEKRAAKKRAAKKRAAAQLAAAEAPGLDGVPAVDDSSPTTSPEEG